MGSILQSLIKDTAYLPDRLGYLIEFSLILNCIIEGTTYPLPLMAKVDHDVVKFILQRNEIDVRKVNSIIEDIEQEMKIIKEENPPAPRVPKQFSILISDPENKLPDTDFTGWIVQFPEEESPALLEDKIRQAAYDFNQTPKGRRLPVSSIGEACEAVPARIFKEHDVWVKTKEPVLVLKTNNQLPMDSTGLPD